MLGDAEPSLTRAKLMQGRAEQLLSSAKLMQGKTEPFLANPERLPTDALDRCTRPMYSTDAIEGRSRTSSSR